MGQCEGLSIPMTLWPMGSKSHNWASELLITVNSILQILTCKSSGKWKMKSLSSPEKSAKPRILNFLFTFHPKTYSGTKSLSESDNHKRCKMQFN